MAVFLYVPFPQSLVAGSSDAYFSGTLTGFRKAQPEQAIVFASPALTFSKRKPEGEDAYVTSVALSERISRVFERLRSHDAGNALYARELSASERRPLEQVKSSDILFIVGHSSFTGGYLSLKVLRQSRRRTVVDRYQIRVDTLARQLRTEGLGRGHRYIKLNSCYGGGSDELDRALARDLATELAGQGYGQVKVGGYQYLTSVNQEGQISITAPQGMTIGGRTSDSEAALARLGKLFSDANNPPSDTLLYEADPYRCWYDGSGRQVRWNVPNDYYPSEGTDSFTKERFRQTLVPVLAESDPKYPEWERKKAAEAEWIALMERVERGG